MAKIDLNTVSSGYLSQAALNANFTTIEDEFQNKVLYRDNPSGEPNSMQTHLDMNGYHVLNAGNPSLMDADNIAYTPDGTGAETRTIAEKLNEVVSVKDFGAVGDGVTDDTAAIQAALNSASEGARIVFTAGSYKITSTLVCNTDRLSISGEGPGTTVLYKEFPTNNLFTLGGSKLCVFDFLIDTSFSHTSGILFAFTTTSGNIWINNVFTNKCYDVIDFTQSTQTFISNCIFNNFVHDGIRYRQNCGGQGFINNVRMGLDASTNIGTGLYVEGGDTYHFSNIDITSAYYPVLFQPPAGATLVNIFCTNVTGDGVNRVSGGAGWTINGTASSAILRRIRLTNCWAGVNVLDGFRIQAADDVTLSNCIAIANQQHGVYVTGSPSASNVKILGSTITGNSLNNSNIYSGVRIDDFVNDFAIKDCTIKPITGVSNTQKYGIEINGTNHERYQIIGNDVTGNATLGVNDAGTGISKNVSDNIGYKTHANGFGSISATTSVAVSHGLGITPSQADILITPTNDPGAGIRWWISAATATTFTITTSSSATFGFAWQARTGGAG